MKCFSAAATVVLAAMLCGCQQKADMTPVWQIDLPTTGVHMELSNTDDISFDPAYYAQTREDAFYNNLHEISAVMAEGAPVVTFYGVTADEVKHVVIAYEPVWAIGTGLTATDEQANETIGVIREAVRAAYGDAADDVRIQYGGSMNPKNCKGLMAQPEIDGGLIGGASLKAEDFSKVVRFDA